MATNAALGASGLSLALGVMNSRTLNSLTDEVEKLKKSMTPANPDPVENAELDADILQDLSTIESPSEINRKSIADVVTRIQSMEEDMKAFSSSVEQINNSGSESTIKDLNSKVLALDAEIQNTLFDVETVVNLEPDIQDILKKWDVMKTKAYVDEKLRFHANDCKLGLVKNLGDESAIHFAGSSDPNWSMYMASPNGRSTDGKAPSTHAGVKGNALRMRIGTEATDGVIIENSNRKGVFSVGADGKTTMGSMVSGDLSADMSGVSYINNHNGKEYAIAQKSNGATFVNSSEGRNLYFCVNGQVKGYFDPNVNRTLVLSNTPGTHNTHFNHDGNNYIRCANNKFTMFRSGTSGTNILRIGNQGTEVRGSFKVDGVDLANELEKLEKRIKVIEDNYIDTRSNRLALYNHVAKKYLSSGGDLNTHKTSIHARYTIQKV